MYIFFILVRRNGALIFEFLWNFNNVLEFDKFNGLMMRNEDKIFFRER